MEQGRNASREKSRTGKIWYDLNRSTSFAGNHFCYKDSWWRKVLLPLFLSKAAVSLATADNPSPVLKRLNRPIQYQKFW